MASLQSNEKQTFDGTSELRAHYGSVRARLGDAPASNQPIAKVISNKNIDGNAVANAKEGRAITTAPSDVLAAIPIEIRDVVSVVAALLAISSVELLSDLGRAASLGRRIAAALVARRSQLSPHVTAGFFGVAAAMVEGALVTLDKALAATQASATHAPLVPLARIVVAEWSRFEEPVRTRVTIAEIQQTVAHVFQCTVEEMKSARRMHRVAAPRHVAMYLAKRFTLRSLPEIGSAFARDHSTAFYAMRKLQPQAEAVAARLPPEASIEDWAQALRQELQ
jgi:hypothetical protein